MLCHSDATSFSSFTLHFSLSFLFHSPVPKLRWRKVDGLMPSKAGSSVEGPTLILPELSFDDEGVYECEAYNSEGSDTYQGRINVQGKVFIAPVRHSMSISWLNKQPGHFYIKVSETWNISVSLSRCLSWMPSDWRRGKIKHVEIWRDYIHVLSPSKITEIHLLSQPSCLVFTSVQGEQKRFKKKTLLQ